MHVGEAVEQLPPLAAQDTHVGDFVRESSLWSTTDQRLPAASRAWRRPSGQPPTNPQRLAVDRL